MPLHGSIGPTRNGAFHAAAAVDAWPVAGALHHRGEEMVAPLVAILQLHVFFVAGRDGRA